MSAPFSGKPLLFDGMESAFIGVATQGPGQPLAVYDWDKLVKANIRQGMTR